MALSDMMSSTSNAHNGLRSRVAPCRDTRDKPSGRHPSITVDQFSDEFTGNRLVDNVAPLLTVILSVIVSRVNLGDTFSRIARSSAQTFDLREMAHMTPMPRLASFNDRFCADMFDAARGMVSTVFTGEIRDVKLFLDQLVERSNAMGEDKPSNSVYLLMLIYLDRLFARCPALMLTSSNVIRMMAAAFTLAFKVLEDVNWGVSGLSGVVGMDWKDLCALESSFLKLLDYRVGVSAEKFRAAEIIFAGEALESYRGPTVLRQMHALRVTGIEDAIAQARNWLAILPPGAHEGMGLLNGLNGSTVFCGTRSTWRTREASDSVDFEYEWELRRRIFGLAFSQFTADFSNLLSSLVRGGEEEAEWQVAGVCERAGLERFRLLRSLLVFKNYSVTKLPPMVKRRVPFTMRSWEVERGAEKNFTAALGPNGDFLVKDGWNAALAPPSPRQEAREDAELAMGFPSSDQSTYSHLDGLDGNEEEGAGFGYSYEGGIRVSLTGSPCTPVGSRGGVIAVNHLPSFRNAVLTQNYSRSTTHGSQPVFSSSSSIPHCPDETMHLADYFYQYAQAEAARCDIPDHLGNDNLSYQREEEPASVRVHRMRRHFDAVRPSESLFSSQPFLEAGPLIKNVGRPEKRRGQAAGGSPTHIMGNVGRRRDEGGSGGATTVGSCVGNGVRKGAGRTLRSQRKRARGGGLGEGVTYNLNVRW